MSLALVVLVSGSGSNLQALLDAAQATPELFRVAAVVSNRADAYGLQRAQQAGVPTEVLRHADFPEREGYDAELQRRIDAYQPGLVALAGFMRILSPGFVQHYQGRMINIHPSLLPQFKGLHTHRRALEAGVREHGASVHFVTAELDSGPLIVQARVPVLGGDDETSLAVRVLTQEHRIYPLAVRWFAQGRLRLESEGAALDGELLTPQRVPQIYPDSVL